MFTRPDEPTDTQLADALQRGWGLRADDVTYLPVGFGSYHWRVVADAVAWFVTVDDLQLRQRHRGEPLDQPRRRLTAALATAVALRDAGLTFVVAPTPTHEGHPLWVTDARFAVALYAYVEGTTHTWGAYTSREERMSVVELLATLHRTTGAPRSTAIADDLAIPSRDELHLAMNDLDRPWTDGPYGELARRRLREHVDAMHAVLERFDELAAEVTAQTDRLVVTHGEPHRANTIATADGVVLIDWDTTLLAPPERDLWMLVREDPKVADAYADRTGVVPDQEVLDAYRLWWELTEVALYLAEFRAPHEETEDTRTAWQGLTTNLDPARW
jgi:thiamine kinase-like enzyme